MSLAGVTPVARRAVSQLRADDAARRKPLATATSAASLSGHVVP